MAYSPDQNWLKSINIYTHTRYDEFMYACQSNSISRGTQKKQQPNHSCVCVCFHFLSRISFFKVSSSLFSNYTNTNLFLFLWFDWLELCRQFIRFVCLFVCLQLTQFNVTIFYIKISRISLKHKKSISATEFTIIWWNEVSIYGWTSAAVWSIENSMRHNV